MGPEQSTVRDHILEACARVVTERGIAGATTRAIAEAAGCAEGTLYRYFPDKHALFHELVHRDFPGLLDLLATLPDRAGVGTVRRNLKEVVIAAVGYYRLVLPMVVGVMSEQRMLLEQRRAFEETQHGPMRSVQTVADYLRREQRLGRVCGRVSPLHVAKLLLGGAFLHAFYMALMGEDYQEIGTTEQFARGTVRALVEGLKPPKGAENETPVVHGAVG